MKRVLTRIGMHDDPRWRDALMRAVLTGLLPLLFFGSVSKSHGVNTVSQEYQLKAVFLWRIAQFVQWPTNSFRATNDPVVIGVLGINPFGSALDVAVRGETIQNRPIQVRYFTNLAEIRGCHMLYVGESEMERVGTITRAVGRRSILTVSDIESFATKHGGMVRFVFGENKVRLRVNLETVKASRLVLDPRLLRMSEIVSGT